MPWKHTSLLRFCNVHIICPINVCTNFEINRYNIDEFRKYAKIVFFIWRHVTQKRYVVHRTSYGSDALLIYISIRNILPSTRSLYDFRFKSYDPRCVFFLGDIDLDLWPILYLLSHNVRMRYWSLISKFHRNPSSIIGWYSRWHTHTHTHTHTHKHTHKQTNKDTPKVKI